MNKKSSNKQEGPKKSEDYKIEIPVIKKTLNTTNSNKTATENKKPSDKKNEIEEDKFSPEKVTNTKKGIPKVKRMTENKIVEKRIDLITKETGQVKSDQQNTPEKGTSDKNVNTVNKETKDNKVDQKIIKESRPKIRLLKPLEIKSYKKNSVEESINEALKIMSETKKIQDYNL